MKTAKEQINYANACSLYNLLLAGRRVIVNKERYDNLIDQCGDRPRMDELASCLNRKRVGVEDENVAWIGTENKPHDLELGITGEDLAIGSK